MDSADDSLVFCTFGREQSLYYLTYFMALSPLTAILPVDGRYRSQVESLSVYFSEYALIRYRLFVEVEYLIALSDTLSVLSPLRQESLRQKVRSLYEAFDEESAARVKEIERVTNHDVKAVEYFIKENLTGSALEEIKEYVHFGLTSQDINNTAQPLMLKEALQKVWLPKLKQVRDRMADLAQEWKDIPMLARTHGQPASPTKLGKEIRVFVYRLDQQVGLLETVPHSVKFGGATGNMNAHHLAYPTIDWRGFARTFVQERLRMNLEEYTTQISNYDNLAATFDALKRICVILVDFCRDMWQYISNDYFKQKIKPGEVGSSAMPHKVNPIDYENAEGNLGLAIAMSEHLSHKLPISRLQRDLTDSTVMRNIGMPIAYSLIALESILKGLNKVILHEEAILSDLDNALPVVAEALQTILRREKYPNAYEALKELTRTNEKLTPERLLLFIDSLDINEKVKEEMRAVTPRSYTGVY